MANLVINLIVRDFLTNIVNNTVHGPLPHGHRIFLDAEIKPVVAQPNAISTVTKAHTHNPKNIRTADTAYPTVHIARSLRVAPRNGRLSFAIIISS